MLQECRCGCAAASSGPHSPWGLSSHLINEEGLNKSLNPLAKAKGTEVSLHFIYNSLVLNEEKMVVASN